jgi:hypothetical protein
MDIIDTEVCSFLWFAAIQGIAAHFVKVGLTVKLPEFHIARDAFWPGIAAGRPAPKSP